MDLVLKNARLAGRGDALADMTRQRPQDTLVLARTDATSVWRRKGI